MPRSFLVRYFCLIVYYFFLVKKDKMSYHKNEIVNFKNVR